MFRMSHHTLGQQFSTWAYAPQVDISIFKGGGKFDFQSGELVCVHSTFKFSITWFEFVFAVFVWDNPQILS